MHHPIDIPRERAGCDDVTVRWAAAGDEPAIRRVAERDSRVAPTGPALVAEVAGEIVAAVSLNGGEAVADPFHPTSDVVDLLELRATQLTTGGREKGRGAAALWLARSALAGGRREQRAPAQAV